MPPAYILIGELLRPVVWVAVAIVRLFVWAALFVVVAIAAALAAVGIVGVQAWLRRREKAAPHTRRIRTPGEQAFHDWWWVGAAVLVLWTLILIGVVLTSVPLGIALFLLFPGGPFAWLVIRYGFGR